MTEIERVKFQIDLFKKEIKDRKEICDTKLQEIDQLQDEIKSFTKEICLLQDELNDKRQGELIFS